MTNKLIYPLSTSLFTILFCTNIAYATPLSLATSPLFLTNAEKANVLVILDNSNSMDEAANGAAVGGANPNSKSEIARGAIENLITTYEGKINMGLMAYQQNANALRNLHNSPYDASFDPANYDPLFTGGRDSLTKRFRTPNVSNPGAFVYYNIALPFYSGGNAGNSYCYTTTSTFDNGTETYPAGPWDNYRCFQNKTSTSDAIPTFNNSASETASGFITNNGINGGFSPTDSDLAQNLLDFGTFLTWDWVSLTWFANTSPGRGYLHMPIRDLEDSTTVANSMTQVAGLNTKLEISQFVNNGPTNPALSLQNAGLTPLEGTLLTANDYFSGTALPADEGGPAPAIPESCGKNFIALLTDGLPSTNAAGTVVTNSAAALLDVADAANTLANNIAVSNGVETYVVGFALPVGTDPTALDTIAQAGGTNTAYMANDPTSLQAAFDNIFTDILAKTGASSSAATNSTSLSINSFIYQARFNSGTWAGELLAKSISLAGIINLAPTWDAADVLNSKTPSNRVILTYGRDTNDGIPFRWADINGLTDTTAKDALNRDYVGNIDGLGSDRVDFLRGGTGGTSASLFRADRVGKLGDMIHSTPSYVGKPNAGYNDATMPGYAAFRTSNLARTPIIYAGANDGMLHGFKASDGSEVLAYIPRTVFPNLNKLTALDYGTTVPHQYFVDGSPIIADANLGTDISPEWKTVLAGGLRAGGQGVYALDITDPSFTEANAAATVLWEFSDEDDVDLGYTFTQPTLKFRTNQSAQIAKMANDKWAVIIGNGYNNTDADGNASTTGHAYLYILFIEEGTDGVWTLGTDYIKIDTGVGTVGTPNGLATPTPVDVDGDRIIDYIYAGDLLGNLWKFDVTSSTPTSWEIAVSGNQPLFTALDSSSNPQPITSAPLFTRHPNGGYMIGFGTGKYIELTDTSNTDPQTIYGIWDQNTNISNRSDLVEQTIVAVVTVNTDEFRIFSNNSVDYSSKKGWYMDLPESGERVDVNPIGRDGRFVFATRTPSSAACTAGGDSWLMELNYLTGGRLDISPFDVNDDGAINDLDFQTITVDDGEGNEIEIKVPVGGLRSGDGGMISTPTVISTDENGIEYKITTSSKGIASSVLESTQTSLSGRISWKEIR